MASGIPKQRILKAITDMFSDTKIRSRFNILRSTGVVERLHDIRKDLLEDFLISSSKGRELFRELQQRFPQNMPRTFFLVKLAPRKYTEELEKVISEIAKRERDNALIVNSKIRAVYLEGDGSILSELKLLEIPLAYERKLEYQIGDPPDSVRYGEFEQTYSLEHAFIWLINDYSHGIVCCSDLAALQAILKFARDKLSLNLSVPNMTENVFSRLIEKTETSSATFSGFPTGIPTVTIYARNVGKSDLFQELESNPNREQTAGFFRNTAGELFASFGISRRYARIWTPWHYSKPWLINAGKMIIDKTNAELSSEFKMNSIGYLSYFANVTVVVDGKIINGRARKLFQRLLEEILNAYNHKNEVTIDFGFLEDLIKYQSKLDLHVFTNFECSNCGGGLGRCPECLTPYDVKNNDGAIIVTCSRCECEVLPENVVTCECGTEMDIARLENHIQVVPGVLLQKTIENFINQNLDEFNWQGVFVIDGLLLRLVKKRNPRKDLPETIKLNQLDLWSSKARFEKRKPNQKHLTLLTITKEKCFRNGVRPTIEGCKVCMGSIITEAQIRKRKEVCLPRIFGLPIEKKFDGIHHGFEIADIKYKDAIAGKPVSIGIHLKSRTSPRPKGLGRAVYSIKSLYTQAFYSAYQVFKGDADFDVIGISIPNTISKEVVVSIQFLINKLGYSLLVLEESDWLKIFDAALEVVAFKDD